MVPAPSHFLHLRTRTSSASWSRASCAARTRATDSGGAAPERTRSSNRSTAASSTPAPRWDGAPVSKGDARALARKARRRGGRSAVGSGVLAASAAAASAAARRRAPAADTAAPILARVSADRRRPYLGFFSPIRLADIFERCDGVIRRPFRAIDILARLSSDNVRTRPPVAEVLLRDARSSTAEREPLLRRRDSCMSVSHADACAGRLSTAVDIGTRARRAVCSGAPINVAKSMLSSKCSVVQTVQVVQVSQAVR